MPLRHYSRPTKMKSRQVKAEQSTSSDSIGDSGTRRSPPSQGQCSGRLTPMDFVAEPKGFLLATEANDAHQPPTPCCVKERPTTMKAENSGQESSAEAERTIPSQSRQRNKKSANTVCPQNPRFVVAHKRRRRIEFQRRSRRGRSYTEGNY